MEKMKYFYNYILKINFRNKFGSIKIITEVNVLQKHE